MALSTIRPLNWDWHGLVFFKMLCRVVLFKVFARVETVGFWKCGRKQQYNEKEKIFQGLFFCNVWTERSTKLANINTIPTLWSGLNFLLVLNLKWHSSHLSWLRKFSHFSIQDLCTNPRLPLQSQGLTRDSSALMSSALQDVWQIRHVGVPLTTENPLEDLDNDCNKGKR